MAAENKNFEDLSREEKNRIIMEGLFGLTVIYPADYYRNLKGRHADYWRERAGQIDNSPVVVKNNQKLHTHEIDSFPLPDFYDENAHGWIAQARAKLAEKNLQSDFAGSLSRIIPDSDNFTFDLINAAPAQQADAIVKVLLEQPVEEKKRRGKKA